MQAAQGANRDRLARGAVLVLLLAAAAVAGSTLWYWYLLHWYGPYKDLWLFNWAIGSDRPLADWLKPFNGAHRVLLTEILYRLDYRFDAGRNRVFFAVALACQAGMAALFLAAARRLQCTRRERWVVAAVCVLFLFGAGQLFNFLYSFDVQWHLAAFFAMAMLYGLVACERLSWRAGAMALLLYGLASFSNAAGQVVVLLVPVLLWLRGLRGWQAVLLLAALAWGLDATVDHSSSAEQDEAIRQALSRMDAAHFLLALLLGLVGQVHWVFNFLAAPLSIDHSPWAQGLMALVMVWMVYGWRHAARVWPQQGMFAFVHAVASWGLLVAMAACRSRGFFADVAFDERYQTVVLLFWLAVLLGVYLRFRHLRWAPALSGLAALCWVLPSTPGFLAFNEDISWTVRTAHRAAAWGATDVESMSPTLPIDIIVGDPAAAVSADAVFRAANKAYYREMDGPAGDLPETAPPCRGSVAGKTLVSASHAWLQGRLAEPLAQLAVRDAGGRPVGAGRVRHNPDGQGMRPWKAVLLRSSLDEARLPLQVLAYGPGRLACLLARLDGPAWQALPDIPDVWGDSYWKMVLADRQRAAGH